MKSIHPTIPPLLAALLFGVSTPLAKLLLGEMPPMMLAGVLYLGSGAGLGLWMLVRRAEGVSRAETPLRRRDVPWLAAVVLTGGMLAPVLLMMGLARTTGSTASLLLNLEGMFTALLAWFVFREHFHSRILAGMVAIAAGGIVLSWSGPLKGESLWSVALIAAACLCWAIDNNLTRKISTSDPVQIAAVKGGVAGAVNCGIAFSLGVTLPSAQSLAWVGVVGFLGYGLSLVFFIRGLRQIGTARTVVYFSTAPFIGAAVAVGLFGEPITIWLASAAVLMGLGVWLHLTERHEHEHHHEELTHEHHHVHDEHHQHAHSPTDPLGEPHSHPHRHEPLGHSHPHYPDIHHRHRHHTH